jgi:hypothetical protein
VRWLPHTTGNRLGVLCLADNGIGVPFSSPDPVNGDYRNGVFINAAGDFAGYYLNTIDYLSKDPATQLSDADVAPSGEAQTVKGD